jgi:N-methylhydantoinase A
VPKVDLKTQEPDGRIPAPVGRRPVYFGGNEPFDTPIYWRPDLPAGAKLAGPAIIDQLDSTTVLPPGDTMTVDRWSNIIIKVGGES